MQTNVRRKTALRKRTTMALRKRTTLKTPMSQMMARLS